MRAQLLNQDGKVIKWSKRYRRDILSHISAHFRHDTVYSETEVNQKIKELIDFEDYALVRRELYDNKYLDRDINCREYWVNRDKLAFRQLGIDADFDLLIELVQDCNDYYQLVDGKNPTNEEVKELFCDVPSGYSISNLNLQGIFEDNKLLGAIWIVKEYPTTDNAYIGLLLIAARARKRGIGNLLVNHAIDFSRERKYQAVMLSVVKDNFNAISFWQRLGFEIKRELPIRKFGNKMHERFEFIKFLNS
jgi:ribosomal protein S18 acetylase RimI-like enzyme